MTAAVGDVVLRWASEAGAGSWPRLSEVIASASTKLGAKERPWLLAERLSTLGHLEVDWDQRSWSVAPPCLALPQGTGGCAYLAGWRTSHLMRRLAEVAEAVDLFDFDVPQPDLSGPAAHFLKASQLQPLLDAAHQLGIKLVLDPAAQLAELVEVPFLDQLADGAAPPPVEEIHRFDDAHLTWVAQDAPNQPGLYRFELHGRRTFRLLDGARGWKVADRAAGQMIMLKGRADVLRLHLADAAAIVPAALSVPASVSLPPLAERALVASLGLLPRIIDGRRTFLNVNRALAAKLAERLHLELSLADPIALGA